MSQEKSKTMPMQFFFLGGGGGGGKRGVLWDCASREFRKIAQRTTSQKTSGHGPLGQCVSSSEDDVLL